jgi:hypothetical protein
LPNTTIATSYDRILGICQQRCGWGVENQCRTVISVIRPRPRARAGSPASGCLAGNLMRLIGTPAANKSIFDSMFSMRLLRNMQCRQTLRLQTSRHATQLVYVSLEASRSCSIQSFALPNVMMSPRRRVGDAAADIKRNQSLLMLL